MIAKQLKAAAITVLATAAIIAAAAPVAEAVTPSPAWRIESLALPSNFSPEDESQKYYYEIRAVDITGAPLSSGVVTISDTLPAGLGVKAVALKLATPDPNEGPLEGKSLCETTIAAEVPTVTCKVPGKFSGRTVLREAMTLKVTVTTPVSLEGQELINVARIQGAGATAASATSKNRASSEVAQSGFARFDAELLGPDGTPTRLAASHPYLLTTSFELNTEIGPKGSPIPAQGDLRDVRVTLPPGLIGNPTSTTYCTPQQFNELVVASDAFVINACPKGSVVGIIDTLAEDSIRVSTPIFNLIPPLGMPAQLGLQVAGFSFYIDTELGPGPNHQIVANLTNLTEIERPIAGRVALWGTPAEESHDGQRGSECLAISGVSLGSCPSGLAPKPFLRLPTSCEFTLPIGMAFDTWDNPQLQIPATSTLPAPDGCSQVSFSPTISARPQNLVADSPSGLTVNLHNPQSEDPEQLGSADLRNITVTLPRGLTVNPASGAGLAACSPAQIELNGNQPPRCPDASKVGTLEVSTPLLDHPAKGAMYLATQNDNPFGSLIAIYVVIDDPQSGAVVKLAGKVTPDPLTGQLTSTFVDSPQFPIEDVNVEFFNGPRAALRMPKNCGTYATTTDLRPWSAPQSGPDATPSDSFTVASGPGGPCPTGALSPQLSAGVAYPIAGAYTPFSLRLSREDGSDEFAAVNATNPTGLTAKLKGIPYCSETGIAQAIARSNPGQGALEASSPSCSAGSRVGSATAGAGSGPNPVYVSGKVYLAGPYKGAPLSLLTVVPAVTGPFDLGVVTTRIALRVDPQTAQVSAQSDQLPTILSGIPVDARDIRVNLDRPDFTLAPTNCKAKTVHANVLGLSGARAETTDSFQVGACKALDFSPSLSLQLKGGTKRNDHPALRATLKASPGQANLARVEVILPPAQFIDPNHINNPCTRVQFNAGACPKSSILGKVRAFTPLLDEPLEGPIYFRSNGGERELPDVVADLNGQIHVLQVGFVDAIHKKGSEVSRIRTTFATVPDAPLSKVVIDLKGGKKQGLLVNSRNLCKSNNRVTVKMDGQNGRIHDTGLQLKNQCSGGK